MNERGYYLPVIIGTYEPVVIGRRYIGLSHSGEFAATPYVPMREATLEEYLKSSAERYGETPPKIRAEIEVDVKAGRAKFYEVSVD